MIPFKIDSSMLDELTQKAVKSKRKRMNFDLRDSENEDSMRMLNAIEPEAVIPIHRHTMTSEDVVILRGCVDEILYDDDGNEIDRVRLEAGTSSVFCHVPLGCYHSCRSLLSGSVIIEFKATRYDKILSEELL